jgi:type IV fimbrial biogenesis protein FimT
MKRLLPTLGFRPLAPAPRLRHRRARPSQGIGFTLIEMLAVLLVLVAILALAAPSFQEMINRQRVKSVANELAADMQYARSEALRMNYDVIVAVDGTATRSCYSVFWYKGTGQCSCRRTPVCFRMPAEELRTTSINNNLGVRVQPAVSTNPAVRFLPGLGQAESADLTAAFGINVTGNRARARVLVALTGRVSICSPDGSIKDYPACS